MALSDTSNKHYGSPKQIWTLDFVKDKNVSHACVPKPVGRVCPQASIYLPSYTPCMYPQSRPVRKFVALLHMFHLSLRCHVMQHGRTIRGRWLVWKAGRTRGSCMSRFNRRTTRWNKPYFFIIYYISIYTLMWGNLVCF